MTRGSRRDAGLALSPGFTLIELLVVMAILATLVGLTVALVPTMARAAKKSATDSFITTLNAALELYRSADGAYPPQTLTDYPGVGALSNDENVGIESVVLCLNSRRYQGSFDFGETDGSKLDNADGDQTQTQVTKFGSRDLFEAVDPWKTPYVYFNAQAYTRGEDYGRVSGVEGRAIPWTDPTAGRSYRYGTFQIISAGPDMLFNTADDITNFGRR